MGHLQAYRAAVGGKHHGNNARRSIDVIAGARRLIVAAVTLFVVSISGSASHAQSGPFNGLAGTWSGVGTVILDDGSTERIRCRATYAVGAGGKGLNQSLTCASDAYKFNLSSNVTAEGATLSGTWSESSRNVSGTLQGRGSNGNFELVASTAGFSANIALKTNGNKQSVVIKAEGAFKGANITLSRT